MTADKPPKIGAILLAAGGSSRLGRPKQLLEFQGKTLLRHAAETLVKSNCDPIVVVLGAETVGSRAELSGLDVSICINDNWQTGMSSSIRSGISDLLKLEPDLDAVMITLCDQPKVTADKINLFVNAFLDGRGPIVAAQYGETLGVPALFSRDLFAELLELDGDKGARDLIRKGTYVASIDLDEAAFDIDTITDAEGLITN